MSKEEEIKPVNLNRLVTSMKKEFGSLMLASDDIPSEDFISTGNLALDCALDGGIAFGYVSELLGMSQSGKTTVMQIMLADAQKKYNAIGIWADRENAWHNARAEQLGIDTSRVVVLKPQDIPEVTDYTLFLQSMLPKLTKDPNQYIFIAMDSVAAFDDPTKADKSDMGKKSQQVHRHFRKILPLINKKTSYMFSNHVTFKIGQLFGDPETSTGGEATKFYPSYRMKFDNRKSIIDEKRGKENLGNWINAYIIKTRSGPSHRQVKFHHLYASGIDYYGGYARMLVDRNYIQPKNKTEFKSFKQTTVVYKEKEFNEFDIGKKLIEYPELMFDKYPKYFEGGE